MSTVDIDFGDRNKVNWTTMTVVTVFHVLAVVALFYTTWQAVAVALVLHWMCVGWGIALGYHRLHTHRAYKCPKFLEYFFAVLGTMTMEGGPIFWAAVHRVHHQRSDQHGDPHTPRDGRWWAHILWMLFGAPLHSNTKLVGAFAPDLNRDRFYRWLNSYHWLPLTLLGVALLAIGGLPWVLWGIFLRVVVGLHVTWLVNSATHLWGSRRFETTDDSRNSWWVALITFGEGWHNNHHAHPSSARHGFRWYELDMAWLQLRVLEKIGLVWDLKVPRSLAA